VTIVVGYTPPSPPHRYSLYIKAQAYLFGDESEQESKMACK
jgi:hypothetical protein